MLQNRRSFAGLKFKVSCHSDQNAGCSKTEQALLGLSSHWLAKTFDNKNAGRSKTAETATLPGSPAGRPLPKTGAGGNFDETLFKQVEQVKSLFANLCCQPTQVQWSLMCQQRRVGRLFEQQRRRLEEQDRLIAHLSHRQSCYYTIAILSLPQHCHCIIAITPLKIISFAILSL